MGCCRWCICGLVRVEGVEGGVRMGALPRVLEVDEGLWYWKGDGG